MFPNKLNAIGQWPINITKCSKQIWRQPIKLRVIEWPCQHCDYQFISNTCHMSHRKLITQQNIFDWPLVVRIGLIIHVMLVNSTSLPHQPTIFLEMLLSNRVKSWLVSLGKVVGNHVTLLHEKFVWLEWPIQICNFSTTGVPWEFHKMPYLGCKKTIFYSLCEKVHLYADINMHERDRVNCGGSLGYYIVSIVVMYFTIHTLLFTWKENMIALWKKSHICYQCT